MTHQENSNSKAWLGIVLVAIGSFFLLRNLDLIPNFIPYWVFSWEMIFVIAGGAMLATGRREGLVFLGIGAFFILPDILHFPHFRMRDWWPLILIAIGLVIVVRRREHFGRYSEESKSDVIDDVSIFGGSGKSISSKSLKGGRITAIFGGSELNLADADLGKSEVVIDCFCMFGGTEITVPSDWIVINEAFTAFGGFDDKSIPGKEKDPNKVLRFKGLILFGGVEVRRY